jgi:hypothetical protein
MQAVSELEWRSVRALTLRVLAAQRFPHAANVNVTTWLAFSLA